MPTIEVSPLEAILRDKGMTRAELARLSGVSRSTIARFERGKGTYFHNLKKMADVLGVEVQDLYENEGE